MAGSHDAAVRAARAAAGAPDAVLVQDMAREGYEEIPALIVEGYRTLFAEVDAQLDAAVAVTDADGMVAARDLARLGVASGPCGAAALAGARAARP
ncbi:hypothetical protein ABZ953_28680 [Streptomyces sp. NPDC046465]|uniref:hypothetical protein n=1 Tax=Streptomyces sp. NPDC046465 TaxID=3155810 RepID=UPI003400A645